MSLGIELHGVRNESHLLYAASYAHAMNARFSNVLLCDVDAVIQSSARAAPWLQRLGAGIEVVESLPTSLDRVDRAYIGSPSIRRVFDPDRPLPPARSVVLDEGFGSYGSIRERCGALRREGSAISGALARATARTLAITLASRWRWRTYEPSGQGWVINEAIARAFRIAAEPAQPSDRIMLLTQPWVELGIATETQIRATVSRIADAAQSAGLELAVCSHPRERVRRYNGLTVLHGAGPSELQAAVTGARLVLGDTSSALLNIAAIFGVASLRVSGLAAAVSLSKAQQGLLDYFVGPPVPISELTHQISRLTE